MKEIGKMIKLMEKVFISIKMEEYMMEIGFKINKRDLVKKNGQMVRYMKVLIRKD